MGLTFATDAASVRTPATSANLGPGFDALGLALARYDDLTARVTDGGYAVAVTGHGAGELPTGAGHLVVRAMLATFDELGERPPGLAVECVNRIPQARGLGSSSAAIVGGVQLARALVSGGMDALDDAAALRLAARLEGHPDNVAPALYGGFVICGETDEDVWADRSPVHRSIGAVVLIPPGGVATALARGLLPGSVPHRDAAANTGRAALLVAALATAPDRLHRATEDFLHQRYRRSAMPDTLDLVDRLRADGHAAVVSGAGPAVLVLTADGRDLAAYCPDGWAVRRLEVASEGARVF